MAESQKIEGYIHSYESMGLVDGPGIRFVTFMQGCALRCVYCHNPDTWEIGTGKKTTPEELFETILRFKPYFKASGGGVTFSGGEPLLQPEFIIEMLKLCKAEGIHTAIDTAGVGKSEYYGEILSLADLIMLDVKHVDEVGYKRVTERDIAAVNSFADRLRKSTVDVWLRAVIVPTINNTSDYITRLTEFAETFSNVKKVELLPYHTLGVNKYEQLGLEYKLKDVVPMDKKVTSMWQEKINSQILRNRA